MSWSFHGVGRPSALKAAIDADLGNYGAGQSREEYEQAAPHLKGLLDAADDNTAVSVVANGHASFVNGKRQSAYVSVDIKTLGKIFE